MLGLMTPEEEPNYAGLLQRMGAQLEQDRATLHEIAHEFLVL